jgi:hypothetical protein
MNTPKLLKKNKDFESHQVEIERYLRMLRQDAFESETLVTKGVDPGHTHTTGTPPAHAPTHESGGSDELDHGTLAGSGSKTHAEIDAFMVQNPAIAIKTADYTITASDGTILASASIGPLTIKLPAAPSNGHKYTIKCTNNDYACTIGRNGKTIDGDTFDLNLLINVAMTLQYANSYGWALI